MTNFFKKLLAGIPAMVVVLTVGIVVAGCGSSTTTDDAGGLDASTSTDLAHKG